MGIYTSNKRETNRLSRLFSTRIHKYDRFYAMYLAATTTETLTWTSNASQTLGGYWFQAVPNDGDEFSWQVILDAGVYSFGWCGLTFNNTAKIDWYLDDVLIQSGQDWYSASIAYGVTKTFNYSIPSEGKYTVKLKVNGKNASSSGYYLFGTYMEIKP